MGWFRVLIETWWWVLLGALLGLIVGYLLGKLFRDSDVSRHPQVASMRSELDEHRSLLSAKSDELDAQSNVHAALSEERDGLDERVRILEGELQECHTKSAALAGAASSGGPTEAVTELAFDAATALAAMGTKVRLDDLKVVEGIGPKIEQLLHADGIRTWRALSNTPVQTLRDILHQAGERFRIHDPATWPDQAGLAADRKFAELRALQDRLDGGREERSGA